MNSSSRGLPGFLRRTRRSDFDETTDEDEGSSAGGERIEDEDPTEHTQNNNTQNNHNNSNNNNSNASIATPSTIRRMSSQTRAGEAPSARAAPPIRIRYPPSDDDDDDDDEQQQAGDGTEPGSSGSTTSSLGSGTATPMKPSSLRSLDRKTSYREIQFTKILNAPVVKLAELRKLCWNGIPPENRAMAWKLLLGYLPTNQARRSQALDRKRAEYRIAIRQHYDIDDDARTVQEQETLRQVLVDVPRTQPQVPLFRNERIKKSLGRLLYVWAMRHPASSYVQGINDLATPLFAVFLADYYNGGEDVLDGAVMVVLPDEKLEEVEADVYWCLTSVLAGIQDHYTADQPGVQRMVMRLEELVQRIDGDLCEHLEQTGIQFLQFAFKWMNCLLLREFHLRCVLRLWDTYLSEENSGFETFHVYVCAAFLCQFSPQLREMGFDDLFRFMQEVPTEDWGSTEIEMLLSQAYVLGTLFGGSDAHLTNTGHPGRNSFLA